MADTPLQAQLDRLAAAVEKIAPSDLATAEAQIMSLAARMEALEPHRHLAAEKPGANPPADEPIQDTEWNLPAAAAVPSDSKEPAEDDELLLDKPAEDDELLLDKPVDDGA